MCMSPKLPHGSNLSVTKQQSVKAAVLADITSEILVREGPREARFLQAQLVLFKKKEEGGGSWTLFWRNKTVVANQDRVDSFVPANQRRLQIYKKEP